MPSRARGRTGIRLGWGQGDADIARVMDREQERLARSLGDGHRLLRGVAGSGKTVTLVCRARHRRALHPAGENPRQFVRQWVETRLARGISPDAVLILALHRAVLEPLAPWLRDRGVPASLLAEQAEPGTVKLSTLHGAKGLDATHVLVIHGHHLDRQGDEDGRRLLYIAMTRATDEFAVCHHGDSPLMAALDATVEAASSSPRGSGARPLSLA